MRNKKLYTIKQWKKFKKTLIRTNDGAQNHVDIQELMCKKYDIILTDHKTKRELVITILKKINAKNINDGIYTFNKAVQAFGGSMEQLSKDLGSSKKSKSSKDKENLEKLLGKPKGKSSNNVKIWSDSPRSESRRKKDEMNLEKLWGS